MSQCLLCTVPPAQVIVSFSISASSIVAGSSATLSWRTQRASTVFINGQSVSKNGSLVVRPTGTTSYQLTVNGPAPAVTETLTLTVSTVPPSPPPPPPQHPQTIDSFTASSTATVSGTPITLTWHTSNATAVRLNGVLTNATSAVVAPAASTSYTLLVSGTVPDISQTIPITVTPPAPPPTPQTIDSFTVTSSSIIVGAGITLTWATSHATIVTLNGTPVAVNGSSAVSPTVTTTYTLVVSGSAPNLTQSLTVTVSAPVLSIGNARVNESALPAAIPFTVTMSEASPATVLVNYATSDGTARAGVDYTAANGVLTYLPTEVVKTISIAGLANAALTQNVTFAVTLSAPIKAVLGQAIGTGTIVDDNAPPPPPPPTFEAPHWTQGTTIAMSIPQGGSASVASLAASTAPLSFANVYDQLLPGVSVTGIGGINLAQSTQLGQVINPYSSDVFVYADDGQQPTTPLADWVARSTAVGVTFATDFSEADAFVARKKFANGFDPTLLARIFKQTGDGITNGCCLQVSWPAGSSDGSPAYFYSFNPAVFTDVTKGMGTTPYYFQYRYKVPLSRMTPSVTAGGGGFKLLIIGGYDLGPDWQSDSFSDIGPVFVNQNTFYRGYLQGYTHTIASNGQWNGSYEVYSSPFVSQYENNDLRMQNAVDNGPASVDQAHRFCLYSQTVGPSPPAVQTPGAFVFIPDEWLTIQCRVEYKTYGWIGSKPYAVGDQVDYNNNVYVCTTANSDATFTVGNWNNLGVNTTPGLRGNKVDVWAAHAGATVWSHIITGRDMAAPVDTTYTGGPNGFWLTTYDTGAGAYPMDTYVRYDQFIASTRPIALPVF